MPNILSPEHVDIWFCRPSSINLEQLKASYIKLLTPQEHAKVFRYRFERDQNTSLISRALIRYAVASYLPKTNMNELQFEEGPKGKLALTSNERHIEFNLSHTNDLIALAVTQHNPIGVDVECLERSNDTRSIAAHYFSDLEVAHLHALPDEAQHNRFYDFWTLKESYIKAWGLGLSIPLKDFSFNIGATQHIDPVGINSNISLSFADHRNDTPEHWQSFLLDLSSTHRGALSVHQHKHPLKHRVKLRFYMCTPLVSQTQIHLPFNNN